MTITKRTTKGSSLTYLEMDGNLTHMEGLEQRLDRIDNSDASPKVFTLGKKTAGFRKGEVIEVLSSLCNGSTVPAESGDYTWPNVTTWQALTETDADVTGSSIAYTPPTGTAKVIYEFSFQHAASNAANMGHYKFHIDGTEVVDARYSLGTNVWDYGRKVVFRWVIDCAASADNTDQGAFTSWTSAKTLKVVAREYSSGYQVVLHFAKWWNGVESNTFHRPSLTITAIA